MFELYMSTDLVRRLVCQLPAVDRRSKYTRWHSVHCYNAKPDSNSPGKVRPDPPPSVMSHHSCQASTDYMLNERGDHSLMSDTAGVVT